MHRCGRQISQGSLLARHESEEALQECFIKIWQKSASYSGFGSAWGWCCVIARNAALDRLRREKNQSNIADFDVDTLMDNLQASQVSSDFQSIQSCLEQLKPERRESILLSLVYGLTHFEVSEQLKLPLGTVKAWLRRGLIELRTCLQ